MVEQCHYFKNSKWWKRGVISRGLEVEHLGYAVGYHSSSSWPSLSKLRNNINILIKFHYHDLHFLEVLGHNHKGVRGTKLSNYLPFRNIYQISVMLVNIPLKLRKLDSSEVCLSENLGFIPHKQVSVVYSQNSPS